MKSSSSSAQSLDELEYLQRLPTADELDAEAARRSLSEFVRQAWHVIEPGPLVWGWHLDAVCEHLEAQTRGQIRNLIINIPPRSSKSTIVSIMWPAWEWATSPERRWVFSSYSESLSLDLALQQRRVVESDWYLARFPHVRLAGDQQTKSKFDTTAKGFRISTSTGGTVTGKGGDRLAADDPHNTREAESAVVREGVINWWRRTFSSRGNDAKKVTKTLVMQRVHDRDLSGELLSEGGWEHLCLPTEYESKRRCVTSIGFEDPRTEEGELLQPDRFGPAEVAQAKKDLGSYGYAGQHLQRPAPETGALFQRSWFNNRWRRPGELDYPELGYNSRVINPQTKRWVKLVLSVDATFKKTLDSDLVCIGLWGYDPPDRYLLEMRWERMSFLDTVRSLTDLIVAWPKAREKLIEEAANGAAVIEVLKRKFSGIIVVKPLGGKEARAAAVSPYVEAGNVWLPANAPWVSNYIEEMVTFPRAAHDDAVDMTSQALMRLADSAEVERFRKLSKLS